jgi:hypothetical protein
MLKSEFKQKYAKGTDLKPTLEECWNSTDCKKHFFHAVKKYRKLLTDEEIYDLQIDSYGYAIKHFNGKSAFLTLLYKVSYQQSIKYIRKKIKRSIFKSSKLMDYATTFNRFNFLIELNSEEYEILNRKYIHKETNEEISKILNITKDELRLRVRNLKSKIKTLV